MYNFRIEFSKQAKVSINELESYIINESIYGRGSIKVIDRLIKDIDRLGTFPYIGKIILDINSNETLRLTTSSRYIIVYKVTDDKRRVDIEFIYRKGFDYQSIVDKYQ